MQTNPVAKKPTTPILIPTNHSGRAGVRPGKPVCHGESPGRPIDPLRRINNTPSTPQYARVETITPGNSTTSGKASAQGKVDTPSKSAASKMNNQSKVDVPKNNAASAASAANTTSAATVATKKYEPRIYSDDDIREMTSNGYINVHPSLWDYLPKAAHIRFLKKDDGSGKSRGERFKAGGFVRNHYISEAGHRMMILESRVDGKRNEFGYKTFPVCMNDIEAIWKEYSTPAFIEIHLMFNSLAQKKQQIAELTSRNDALAAQYATLTSHIAELNSQNTDLTNRVTRLENILRSVIK